MAYRNQFRKRGSSRAASFRNKNRIPYEDEEQREFLQWLALEHPEVHYWHTPNGGQRSARQGAMLKMQGVQKGVPDLYLVAPWAPDCADRGGEALPEHLQELSDYLKTILNEVRNVVTREEWSALLHSLGVCPITGIEMKRRRPKGELESDGMQEKWIEDLGSCGIDVEVCHGAEAAKKFVRRRYGK